MELECCQTAKVLVAVELATSPVDVDGVAQGLEGVKADADGEDDLEAPGVHLDADLRPNLDPILNEKASVFEIAEQPEIHGEGHREPALRPVAAGFRVGVLRYLAGVCLSDLQPHGVVDESGEGDEGEESGIPPAVKKVGSNEQEEVLGPEWRPAVHRPVRREDDGQEEQEFEGVEEHQRIKLQTIITLKGTGETFKT